VLHVFAVFFCSPFKLERAASLILTLVFDWLAMSHESAKERKILVSHRNTPVIHPSCNAKEIAAVCAPQ
jgi:hypothetical protein